MDAPRSARRPRPARRARPPFRTADTAAFLDAIALAVLVIAPDGRVSHANRAVEHLLGWKPRNLIGQHLTVLFPETAAQRPYLDFGYALAAQQLWAGALALRCADSALRDVYLSATPIPRGALVPPGVVVSISAARLQHRQEQLSAVISRFAHDVRNPLTMILASTQLAAAHADDRQYVHDCLTSIERAAQRIGASADRVVSSAEALAAQHAHTTALPVESSLNGVREE